MLVPRAAEAAWGGASVGLGDQDGTLHTRTGGRARLPAASCAAAASRDRAGARGPGWPAPPSSARGCPGPAIAARGTGTGQGDVMRVTSAQAPPRSCSGPGPAVLEIGLRSVWEAE